MTSPSGELRIQDRRVQPALNRILGPDAEHQVEPRIMAVLLCLAERPGEVVAKDELIARVWDDVHVSDDVLVRAVGELGLSSALVGGAAPAARQPDQHRALEAPVRLAEEQSQSALLD